MAQDTVLLMSKVEAEEKLKRQIEKGKKMIPSINFQTYDDIQEEFTSWSDYNFTLLEGMFNTEKFLNAYVSGVFPIAANNNVDHLISVLKKDITLRLQSLESIVAQLELIPESSSLSSTSQTTKAQFGNKVFIVHGHDDVAKLEVARYLEKLTLEPIILHEQANQGRTIIEKFEAHSEVGFAIVLLTPDDLGETKAKTSNPQPRARQNVIFELGFFFGKLGRGRVCALLKGDVELPSDFAGIVWVSMTGNWQLQVAREMNVAGLSVDTNKLLIP